MNIIHLRKISIVIFLTIFVVVSSFANIIFVGGTLTNDEIWRDTDTVIIYQDLLVPENILLRIEAGALVKININRGISIDKGRFEVLGTETDSVKFISNYNSPGLTWKWKGILIKNAGDENQALIEYTSVSNAEIGIKLDECTGVLIKNSSILYCQNDGLQLLNSSNCFVSQCCFENNYNGIEILVSYLSSSSYNIISDCILRNENNNVYIYREIGGFYQDNLIVGNIIDSGNNGLWIDNDGGTVNSQNIIEKNLFLNNGFVVGYGLFLANDSTIVRNNIFWKNNIALYSSATGDNCQINNNNFYDNNWAIAVGAGSQANNYYENTFSLNTDRVLGVKETNQLLFTDNNIVNTANMTNIVVNNTQDSLFANNNYWGTTETALINDLIYDKNDDPDLGLVNYKPFLATLNSVSPISPPYIVKKQLVNNRIKLTWINNREPDLFGYNIYYGSFNNYCFTDSVFVGSDTSYFISVGISISDTIAVTSVDSAASSGSVPQLMGNESPYAFAVIYPYAGYDTIICKQQKNIQLNGNIPYAYDSFFWRTTGDGFFINASSLNPIYYPGSQDISSGSAKITLSVISQNKLLADNFIITIIDDPVAYAGADTVVIAGDDINLADAVALNYSAINWFTYGEGWFDYDTIMNPVYHPSYSDIQNGFVKLEMIAFSNCGYATDTVMIKIEPYYSIEGAVWNDEKLVTNTTVIAFRLDNKEVAATQIQDVESDGTFKFTKLMRGNYYIYAIPDTISLIAVPGYYANKLRWQSAYLLPLVANVYDVDITLPSVDVVLPQGDGLISGHLNIPTTKNLSLDIYCRPWFQNIPNNTCNGGLSNNTVFLFNKDKSRLLDYTLTNAVGDFYFNNLPYGTYIVEAEKAGYKSVSSNLISLNVEHCSETNIILKIINQNIKAFNTLIGDTYKNVSVFPNPASTEIVIPINTEITYPIAVKIYDSFGRCVVDTQYPDENTMSYISIDVKDLSVGYYYGNVLIPSKMYRFRFVKND